MKKSILLAACLIAGIASVQAQDKIHRNNGKVVNAKIIEVGASEVKYKNYDNQDGPVYVLETDRIQKIQFENGSVQKFENTMMDMERYDGQLTKAVKFKFLSPLFGYIEVGYEQLLKPGRSVEFSLGIIGAGKYQSDIGYDINGNSLGSPNLMGAFVSGGYKFTKLPSYMIFGKTKMGHLMQGSYLRPNFSIGFYGENVYNQFANVQRNNTIFAGLNLELGKQWVFGDVFLLDIYAGLGYGFDNKFKKNRPDYYTGFDEDVARNFAFYRLGKSPNLTTTVGVKVGILVDWFDTKEQKEKRRNK